MDLKGIGLFEGMPDSSLKKLGKQMREVRHPRGAKPVVRGKDGVGFMVILEGQAEVSTVDGRHRLLGPGDHFGEMALLDQQGRSADITARTDLVAAAIPEWEFKEFLGNHPEVAYRLLQTLSRRLREAEEARETR
jgi:CRP/FNR family transcriptional regulator, cyclic AMP receptor protein